MAFSAIHIRMGRFSESNVLRGHDMTGLSTEFRAFGIFVNLYACDERDHSHHNHCHQGEGDHTSVAGTIKIDFDLRQSSFLFQLCLLLEESTHDMQGVREHVLAKRIAVMEWFCFRA